MKLQEKVGQTDTGTGKHRQRVRWRERGGRHPKWQRGKKDVGMRTEEGSCHDPLTEKAMR